MVRRDIIIGLVQHLRIAERSIEGDMEIAGIPDPAVSIHGIRNLGDELTVSLYSSAAVFAVGVRRVRRRDRITVVYGPAVTKAIAEAATFHRGPLQ